MPIDKVDIKVDFHGLLLGVNTVTRIQYFGETVVPNPTSANFATWAYEKWWQNAFQTITSAKFTLSKIIVNLNQAYPSPNAPEYLLPVNEVGAQPGDALPPFCTWPLRKYPAQTTALPSDQEPFRVGRMAWPGVPEGLQDDGLVDAIAAAAVEAYLNSNALLPSVDIGNGAQQFWAGMARPENTLVGGNPLTKVTLNAFNFGNYIGTQNTRKL